MTYVFRAESEFPSACGEQADKGQGGVKQQELVAEVVVPQKRGEVVEGGTYHRGEDGNVGDGAVACLSAGVEAEAEEPQQRTIGVACQTIDGVDDGAAAYNMEDGDAEGKGQGDCHMYAMADAKGLRGLYAILLYPQDIDADTGGQRRHRTIGAGERCGRNADGEGEDDEGPQSSAADEHGQQAVAGIGNGESLLGCKGVEQDTKGEEEQVDGQDAKAIEAHVLLRGSQRAAGQVLLHHVLVDAIHHDGNEHAIDELPQEELCARCVPAEHLPHRTLCNGFGYAGGREIRLVRHSPHDASSGEQHAEGLQGIGANDVLYAASPRIEEDGKQDDAYGKGERKSQRT